MKFLYVLSIVLSPVLLHAMEDFHKTTHDDEVDIPCKQVIDEFKERIWFVKYFRHNKENESGHALRDDNGNKIKKEETLEIGSQDSSCSYGIYKKKDNVWMLTKVKSNYPGHAWAMQYNPDKDECIIGSTSFYFTVYTERTADGVRSVPSWDKRKSEIGENMARYATPTNSPYIVDHKEYDEWEYKNKNWDALQTLSQKQGALLYAVYTPDGQSLIYGTKSKQIIVTKRDSDGFWREMQQLSGHDGPVTYLDVNYHGTELASGSEDKTVRVWDLKKLIEFNRDEKIKKLETRSKLVLAWTDKIKKILQEKY